MDISGPDGYSPFGGIERDRSRHRKLDEATTIVVGLRDDRAKTARAAGVVQAGHCVGLRVRQGGAQAMHNRKRQQHPAQSNAANLERGQSAIDGCNLTQNGETGSRPDPWENLEIGNPTSMDSKRP